MIGKAARKRLAALLRKTDDPYAGGDLGIAQKLGAALLIASSAIGTMLLPLAPPTHGVGRGGWIMAAAFVVSCLAMARWLRREDSPASWNVLMVMSYVGLAEIALMQWAAGPGAPYQNLYLLAAVYFGGAHPPRRVIVFLSALALFAASPLAYDGWDALVAANAFVVVVLSLGTAGIATLLITGVRRQRLDLQRRGDQAEELARVDTLTGLRNRRAFNEALGSEISRARRAGTSLSLVVADLDWFKEINDRHGHPTGDECLARAATAILAEIRAPDSCFRWGGDEFAVLLPGADGAAAEAVGDRIAAAVAAASPQLDGIELGLTYAVAVLADQDGADELIVRAYDALRSKKQGREAQHSSAAALAV
jgi:diguanylate cyclase (GGDEF)-like protein